MATLTVYQASLSGVAVSVATPTASTGDTFANTGLEYVFIYNGNGSTCVVTLDVTATFGSTSAAITDPTVSILTTAYACIGPFPPAAYGATAKVTCSQTTSVTIFVWKTNPL